MSTGISSKVSINKSDFIKFEPNPANDFLKIQIQHKLTDEFDFIAYNLLGSVVIKLKIKGSSAKIDMAKLSNGLYVCELRDKTKAIAYGRFTVLR